MIETLDHVVLICPDLDAAISGYTAVFGRAPDWVTNDDAGGAATAEFRTQNTALELLAPAGDGPVGDRVRDLLAGGGPRLTSLAFATGDIAKAHRTFDRRSLSPSGISDGRSEDVGSGETREWKRLRLSDAACAGVKTFVLHHETPQAAPIIGDASIARLDHVVINTPNPQRALAHYGARLGLRLAMDRDMSAFGARMMFFKAGDVTVEVIHRLDDAQDSDEDDMLWGLSWEVEDLAAAHARLGAAGVEISEIRTGRKPGTEVFTVKSQTLTVPTLFIAKTAR